MGQNFSLRLPRFSFSWVYREQQQQPEQPEQSEQYQEKTEQNQDVKAAAESQTLKSMSIRHGSECGFNYSTPAIIGRSIIDAASSTFDKKLSAKSGPKTQSVEERNWEVEPKYATPMIKRYRLKRQMQSGTTTTTTKTGAELPADTNGYGYATSPSTTTAAAHLAATIPVPNRFYRNQSLPDCRENSKSSLPSSKKLFFVCTPQQRLPPKSYNYREIDNRNDMIQRRFSSVDDSSNTWKTTNGGKSLPLRMGGTISVSEKSVEALNSRNDFSSMTMTISDVNSTTTHHHHRHHHRHHRQQRKRRKSRAPKFGYAIADVEQFLSKCSFASPGNIPVVISASSTLYQTRPGGFQAELSLPLGMVVNAIFKNQNWLYVQTPHAEEGYVGYTSCLPLGVLSPSSAALSKEAPSPTSKSTSTSRCWESNGDVFPCLCGNLVAEKQINEIRGGTRSDGARTPCDGASKKIIANGARVLPAIIMNSKDVDNANNIAAETKTSSVCEQQIDRMYLREASSFKLKKMNEQLYSATATATTAPTPTVPTKLSDGSKILPKQQQQQLISLQTTNFTSHKKHSQHDDHDQDHHHHHHHRDQQQNQSLNLNQNRRQGYAANDQQYISFNHNNQNVLKHIALREQQQKQQHQHQHQEQHHQHEEQSQMLCQFLVAITNDYNTEMIKLKKGEIVTLCERRETKDQQQWFYIRCRDGREGYIPAEVAGHGYL